MIRWGRGNRGVCCVVVPAGCVASVVLISLFSGPAVAHIT